MHTRLPSRLCLISGFSTLIKADLCSICRPLQKTTTGQIMENLTMPSSNRCISMMKLRKQQWFRQTCWYKPLSPALCQAGLWEFKISRVCGLCAFQGKQTDIMKPSRREERMKEKKRGEFN